MSVTEATPTACLSGSGTSLSANHQDCRLVGSRPRLEVPDAFTAIDARIGLHGLERDLPYAYFFEPGIAPVQDQAAEALRKGPVPHETFTSFESYAEEMLRPGYLPVETGWTLFPDGVMGVAVLTRMPGVRAEMWDWWFAWHSEEPQRYRLWHPEAHMVAHWAQSLPEAPLLDHRERYIGRTSLVREIIGGIDMSLAIRFIDPDQVGVPAGSFDGTLIYGRTSPVDNPIEGGCLLHQVRNTPDGCEMRSRFYRNLNPACIGLPAGSPSADAAVRVRGPGLLEHCAQEMNHLGRFLAELHRAFSKS